MTPHVVLAGADGVGMTDTDTPRATATAAELAAIGGIDGNPSIFVVRWQGKVWNARQISEGVSLTRMCDGCWAQPAGMWNPRRHQVEAWIDTDKAADALVVVSITKRAA